MRCRELFVWLALVASGCEEEPKACEEVPGNICAVIGTGELGFNRDGLPAEESDLFLVSAVRPGPDGRTWVMDFNNQRLRVIEEDGLVQTVIGNGFHAFAEVGVAPEVSALENPIDFAFDSQGRLIFVSYHDPRVLTIGDDGLLQKIAGQDDGVTAVEGNEGDGGPAVDAQFIQLDGIVIAPDDTIYVSDSLANRVRVIRDGVIDTVAGNGEQGYTGDGGPGVDAALHWPTALELDPDGNLYIAELRNHVVRKLAPDGTITTFAGTGQPGSAGDGGPATQAQLDQPYGIALDDDGTMYIGARGSFQIRKVTPDGTMETVAGIAREGLSGDGGPALSAQLGFVARVAMDGDSLLIADQSNSVGRRLVLR